MASAAIKTFETAISNVGPKVEVKARRVGGASYQVPLEVKGDRKVTLAIRWIVEAARARSNKDFHNCLSISLKEASESRYWIYVAEQSGLIAKTDLSIDLEEIINILYSIIKKIK